MENSGTRKAHLEAHHRALQVLREALVLGEKQSLSLQPLERSFDDGGDPRVATRQLASELRCDGYVLSEERFEFGAIHEPFRRLLQASLSVVLNLAQLLSCPHEHLNPLPVTLLSSKLLGKLVEPTCFALTIRALPSQLGFSFEQAEDGENEPYLPGLSGRKERFSTGRLTERVLENELGLGKQKSHSGR